MGYNTAYTLKTHNSKYLISDILTEIKAAALDFDNLFYAVDGNGETYDSIKWYDHERDIIKLSKLYPDVIFDLYGEGEDNEDIWHKYFLNGKIQRCPARIAFDNFDEQKLFEYIEER